MGTKIGDLFPREERDLGDFSGRTIAIDAYNAIYQFMASIRQPDGMPLSDEQGRPVSHLMGLLSRTASIMSEGIRPVFVFDGKPHVLKARTLEARREVKMKAQKEWEDALEEGDMERARSKAQQTSRMTDDISRQSKELLELLGIPVVQAPSEGEAQASFMVRRGDVWAAASQDFDTLLFGCPRLIRNLTSTGRRKLPRQNRYISVNPELIDLPVALGKLEINRDQLIDIGILVGTDFNDGIRGVGGKTALKLILKHNNLESVIEDKGYIIPNYSEIRGIFREPEVSEDYAVEWSRPRDEEVLDMLCGEYDFTPDRVKRSLERLRKAEDARSQKRLEDWF